MIAQADARSLPLADDSVSVIVTSPPFYGCGSYGGDIGQESTFEEFVDSLAVVRQELQRVLMPEGRIWIQTGVSRRVDPDAGDGWLTCLTKEGRSRSLPAPPWTRHGDYPFGVFPQTLLDSLLSASPPGTVCDPFCGSGSVGEAAQRHGRAFVGFDVVWDYCEIARE